MSWCRDQIELSLTIIGIGITTLIAQGVIYLSKKQMFTSYYKIYIEEETLLEKKNEYFSIEGLPLVFKILVLGLVIGSQILLAGIQVIYWATEDSMCFTFGTIFTAQLISWTLILLQFIFDIKIFHQITKTSQLVYLIKLIAEIIIFTILMIVFYKTDMKDYENLIEINIDVAAYNLSCLSFLLIVSFFFKALRLSPEENENGKQIYYSLQGDQNYKKIEPITSPKLPESFIKRISGDNIFDQQSQTIKKFQTPYDPLEMKVEQSLQIVANEYDILFEEFEKEQLQQQSLAGANQLQNDSKSQGSRIFTESTIQEVDIEEFKQIVQQTTSEDHSDDLKQIQRVKTQSQVIKELEEEEEEENQNYYYIKKISIEGFEEVIKFGKKTLVYRIKVCLQSEMVENIVGRSFREFNQIYKIMLKSHPNLQHPSFPQKKQNNQVLKLSDCKERADQFTKILKFWQEKEIWNEYLSDFLHNKISEKSINTEEETSINSEFTISEPKNIIQNPVQKIESPPKKVETDEQQPEQEEAQITVVMMGSEKLNGIIFYRFETRFKGNTIAKALHRFNDFKLLHKSIKTKTPFPDQSAPSGVDIVIFRQEKLQIYLTQLVEQQSIRETNEFKKFLGL